jgi:PAS domain S-box-containing protein
MSVEDTKLYRDVAASEAKLRSLINSNIVGISIWELDGRIVEANDAFLRIVGYERDDLGSGRLRWTDFAPSRYLNRDLQELVAQVRSSGRLEPFEWEYFRKDGSRVPVLTGAALLEDKRQSVGFALDLTERKRAEQAQQQSEAYLAETQRLTHTGSWAYNHVKGEFTYYSDEQFRIHGLNPGGRRPELREILGLFHPEDRQRMLDLVGRIIHEKSEYAADYRIVLASGAVRYLHSLGHPILDERGELLEHIGSVVDMTERRRVEQRLLAQNRITRVLSEASSLDEAVPRILQAVCESLGWHVGVAWCVDRGAGVLRCVDLWRRPSPEISQFENVTRGSTGWPGESGRLSCPRTFSMLLAILTVTVALRSLLAKGCTVPLPSLSCSPAR